MDAMHATAATEGACSLLLQVCLIQKHVSERRHMGEFVLEDEECFTICL